MFESRRTLLSLGVLLLTISASSRFGLAQGFKVIHANTQNDAGANTLIQNPGDGLFYGTCESGGAHYPNGCVFKMDTSGTVTLLHSFAGAPGDGSHPQVALFLNDDGLLYGDTSNGGTNDTGTAFKIDTTGGSYAFAEQPACGGGSNGANPWASFFKANDGNLYVPFMECGPANNNGVIERVDTSLAETEIAAFNYLTGIFQSPQGHLLQGSDDMLYGTASATGFCCHYGGIYRVGLGGGAIETVHDFVLGEGLNPSVSAPLLLASDGNFWGTTHRRRICKAMLSSRERSSRWRKTERFRRCTCSMARTAAFPITV